jgi:hypothetical protein
MTGHQHHVHGSLDGEHLAPESTVTITEEEHDREHAIRRGLRLDRGARAKTPAERVELQLRRRGVRGQHARSPGARGCAAPVGH